jgi:DNA-binding HxlR family transcriptional regulator
MTKASEKILTGRSIAGGADNHQKAVRKRTSAAAMMESVFACKWSARILSLIRDGVNRPRAITRGLDGLTTKVLNECLRRLIGFGLLERMSYPEIPPRVEYKLTKFGERFVIILDAVEELQLEIDRQDRNQSPKNTDISAR